jgi:8-oxo-dGTP pyrophosphatase MutT (NUDIX family)
MTERAPDLNDYPGQLVFPGGAIDPSDGGPVAAALREAHEEIGLDADSIHVIGLLAPLALPDSGFLVDPVLAWSPDPIISSSINYAEVTALHVVPLADLASRPNHQPSLSYEHEARQSAGPDLGTLGRMTQTVIDQLLGILPAVRPDLVPEAVG